MIEGLRLDYLDILDILDDLASITSTSSITSITFRIVAASTLPIFPLPLVLFPGVTIPLHIFEPRYRRMLADCLEGDRRFGIVFLAEGTSEASLGVGGDVGCVAHILTHEMLADGRSNITVAGRDRFTLRAFVASPLPYHVGMIVPHEDAPEPADLLAPLATRVRERFERVVRAARTLADDEDAIPDLPDDPALLAFSVASFIDLNVADRQRLLASTSPGERLRIVDNVLAPALDPIEQRAVIHARAKTNGHGGVAHL